MSAILEGLNPQQVKAVELCDQNLLVVAGAGSGKTRVLTHKICYLIQEKNLYPSEILAMTFSNKAAREMKDRIGEMLSGYQLPYAIGTFHSICLKLLKEFHVQADLHSQFSIFDDGDQLALLKRIFKEKGIDPKVLSPKALRWQIAQAKNESIDPIAYLKENSLMSDKALELAIAYQEGLKTNQAMDFGDLLIRAIDLIRKNESVKQALHARWKYILIDEFQDTNQVQKELVMELKSPNALICSVGDEDQCIYTWRGARVENMLEFEQDFAPSTTVKLDQNYRSTKPILDVANAVIVNNKGRRDKQLWTDKQKGDSVDFYLAEDDYAESRYILDHIEKTRDTYGLDLNQFCILYRTHVQSRIIEDEARRRGLAYRILGGTRFYDRLEIKDVISMLKVLTNPFDDVAFERVINKPARGIGAKAIENLRMTAGQFGTSMLQAIPRFKGASRAAKELGNFYLWMQKLSETVYEQTPTQITEEVLKQSGYLQTLENEQTVEAEARIENIEELLRTMADFEDQTGLGLLEFMDQISLNSQLDNQDFDAPMLTMMTVHNSKGLEYPYIYIVGLEEGVFPHQRAIEENDPDEIEEERRLCYVAMTRAEQKLTLLAAQRRKQYRFTMFNPVSRFLSEIPEHLINSIDNPATKAPIQRGYQTDEYSQLDETELASNYIRSKQNKRPRQSRVDTPYQPGAFVMHPNFGKGVIKVTEGQADNLKLTIAFEQAGTKKILLNYCQNLQVKTY